MSSSHQLSILKLYNIFRNCLGILRHRKCDEERINELENYYDVENFADQLKASIDSGIVLSANRKFNGNTIFTILLFLSPEKATKKATFTEAVELVKEIMKKENDKGMKPNLINLIIIIPKKQTSFTNIIQAHNINFPFDEGYIDIFNDKKEGTCKYPFIEDFIYEEFGFDKLTHDYVPKHILMSKEEKEEVIKLYRSKESEFPLILSSDVVVRIIGGVEGTMIKIEREGYSTGISIVYRMIAKNELFEQRKKK